MPQNQMNALLSMKESEEMDVQKYFKNIKGKAIEEFKNSQMIEEKEDSVIEHISQLSVDSLKEIAQEESIDQQETDKEIVAALMQESNVQELLCSEIDNE